MNTHLTDVRNSLVDKFYALQTSARRDSIWARLFGESTDLATLPQTELATLEHPTEKFTGVKDIPLEQIVGTLNSYGDFDHQFRPLKSSLRDQWVYAYLAIENGGWEPIVVHKVGEEYYVEDGHLLISVARSLGKNLIAAMIWEHPVYEAQVVACPSGQCAERSSIEAFAACD